MQIHIDEDGGRNGEREILWRIDNTQAYVRGKN